MSITSYLRIQSKWIFLIFLMTILFWCESISHFPFLLTCHFFIASSDWIETTTRFSLSLWMEKDCATLGGKQQIQISRTCFERMEFAERKDSITFQVNSNWKRSENEEKRRKKQALHPLRIEWECVFKCLWVRAYNALAHCTLQYTHKHHLVQMECHLFLLA